MTIDFEAIRACMPILSAATRFLRRQLAVQGVTVYLSPCCLAEFVTEAANAAVHTCRRGESYVDCLNRLLRDRALFIGRWTTTHETFGREFRESMEIARRFAIPRPPLRAGAAGEVDLDMAAGH